MRTSIPVFKPATLLSLFFRGLTWTIPNDNNEVYLTFDDGPIPEVTPWVLDVLKEKNVKATFFCVGDNVAKNPDIYQRILSEGHTVGNHTYHHVSGWKMKNEDYKIEVDKAAQLIQSNLFRPPYGQISPGQYNLLKDDYKIVMWDVLTKDYEQSLSSETCYQNVVKGTKSGSIIVFHDSIKAECNLRDILEKSIDYLLDYGYVLKSITNDIA